MSRPPEVATTVVGTGRLARSLVPLLGPAGHPVVSVVGRRLAAARATCRQARRARPTTSLRAGAERGQLILLAVPDRSIADVTRELAALDDVDWKRRVVLHHAGALGCEPLEALRRAGAGAGLLHPLQSLGVPALAAEILPESRARIEGDRRGRAAARRLARALGLAALPLKDLSPRDRTAYHAAASLVSNDLLALLAVGAGLLESVGLGHRRALDALLPLIRGTLRQVEQAGLSGPLTGPAPRGDVETLRAHLRRLDTIAGGWPEDREIHRLLSIRLARLALELGEPAAAETLSALGGSKRRRRV
jgi:predicted short-subunit dehydrogenase-like oxidoreductase (DUF2520 family)